MISNVLILAAALTAGSSPGAPTDAEAPVVAISIGDLDLATSAGQARLRRRLDSRIREMCRVEGLVDAHMSGLRNACLKEANASAQAGFTQAVASARRRSAMELASR